MLSLPYKSHICINNPPDLVGLPFVKGRGDCKGFWLLWRLGQTLNVERREVHDTAPLGM